MNYPVPNTQEGWLKRARAFCLHCMGKSKKAVHECTDKDCPWYNCRFEHRQINFLDSGLREVFCQQVESVVRSMQGDFTMDEIKFEFRRQHGNECGAWHANWWGVAMARCKSKGIVQYVAHRRSKSDKRKSGIVAVWRLAA